MRDSLRASVRIDDDGVEVGTNSVQARIQQFGGQAGRGHQVTIPARPFLGINREDQDDLLHMLIDHLSQNGDSA
jgi:phage gpG-like protein